MAKHWDSFLSNCITEVRFFIHVNQEEGGMGLALVSLFSKPDEHLKTLSVNTLWSCEYQGNDALKFINVKTIQAIIAMIPHKPKIPERPPSQRFFLVEKLGLNVTTIARVEEGVEGDEENDTDCI
jgi:hypothetical protein